MNTSSEQKKLLIESMKKLVTHVSNNPQRQKEIFDALSLQDLNKIILNLKDDNQYLRRISALLLCQLFYQNAQTKLAAGKLLSIQPLHGRICLNGIPQSIHKYPSTLKKCIELMQTPIIFEEEQNKICWIINLERKTLKMEHLQYKKFSSFTFIDPLKNIFGFVLCTNKEGVEPQKDLQMSIERAKDIQPHSKTSPLNQSAQLNSQFYKNYIQQRNKSKQSKRSSFNSNYVNLSIDESSQRKGGYIRPITTRQNVNSYTSKREETNTSFQAPKANTIQNISQYARNGYTNNINTKMNRSTFEPSSATHKIQYRQTIGAGESSNWRQIQTDRKIQSDLKQGKKTSGATSPMVSNHQKFYKRVKDILKK